MSLLNNKDFLDTFKTLGDVIEALREDELSWRFEEHEESFLWHYKEKCFWVDKKDHETLSSIANIFQERIECCEKS